MSRRSFLPGILVVSIWLITMGILIRDQYVHSKPDLDFSNEALFESVRPVERWRDIEEYMLIVNTNRESGKKTILGASATVIRRTDSSKTSDTYHADFAMEGKVAPLLPRASVKVSSVLDRDVNLTQFYAEAKVGPLTFRSIGRAFRTLLYIETFKGNESSILKYRLNGGVSMAEMIRPALNRRIKIKKGSHLSTPVVDPFTGKNRGTMVIEIKNKETIRVGGEDVRAYLVISSLGDLRTKMWVDKDGNTLKRQLLGNLTMEKTTREKALKQAPSLDDFADIPELDLSKFAGVPIQGASDNDKSEDGGGSSFGLGVLDAVLR